jgi:hypothetical protein
MWIAGGANWFFGRPPEGWNPWLQLIDAGLYANVPQFVFNVRVQADVIVGQTLRNLTDDATIHAVA